MGQEAKAAVEIRDFPGIDTQTDPHDSPPGTAEVQVNATSGRQAVLVVRGGLARVSFEAED